MTIMNFWKLSHTICSTSASLALLFTIGLQISFTSIQAQDNDLPSLHKAYEDAFLIGTALNRAQIFADDSAATEQVLRADRRGYFYRQQIITDPKGLELARTHFNSVTPENVMKWEEIHPKPDVYDFEAADRFVDFAEAHEMFIVAHTLVWHNQTPDWVFEDEDGNDLSREALLERMRDHIHTIVGRYKGRIHAWDVVNEALNEDGSMRESRWQQIIGDDYIQKAFEFAHEADPDAGLYYNDYAMESPSKRAGAIRLVEELLDKGVPVSGIGSQSHFGLHSPEIEQVEKSINDLASLGIDVMITELDINVLPSARKNGELNSESNIYPEELPGEVQEELTRRYQDLFRIYLDHKDVINRVTMWGVADGGSWLNYLPMERVNYPLLFDRENKAKPALKALIDLTNN
ncbi:MAG: endo-1,4-beta-xylanase [Balneolaceae bacterium]